MKKKFLAFVFAWFALAVYANPTDSTFVINGSRGNLAVHLQLPNINSGDKIPIVILSHGLGGKMDNKWFDMITASVMKEGFGVIRFDFNGHGKSEGRFQDMTISNCVGDLKKVIDWTSKQKYTENVSLVGHSLGGLVNAIAAGQLGKDKVYSSILLAPGGVARDLMLMGNFFGIKFDPWNVPEYIELPNGNRLGRAYIEGARDMAIYEISRQYSGPTLVVNGTHDTIVPISYSERFAYELPNAELRRLEGDDHGLTKTPEATANMIAKWLRSHNIIP